MIKTALSGKHAYLYLPYTTMGKGGVTWGANEVIQEFNSKTGKFITVKEITHYPWGDL